MWIHRCGPLLRPYVDDALIFHDSTHPGADDSPNLGALASALHDIFSVEPFG
jgi:hypothetical protein